MEKVQQYEIIGKNYPKKDAWAKVTGTAKFVADMKLLNMLHGAVKLSEISAGRIISMDISAAEALPGVVCVLTAQNTANANYLTGSVIKQQPVFAYNKIRRKGDIIAVVAAETRDIAREAVKLIKVEYQEYQAVLDPLTALKPGAPLLYEELGTNLGQHFALNKGDAEKAFQQCDVIVNNTYTTAMVQHMYIEPEACLASYDPCGEVTVWGHAHTPFYMREEIAGFLQLPLNKVKAIVPYLGGSFGGKATLSTQCHCAILSYYTHRPVKIVLSREESTLISPKRHPITLYAKTGADNHGHLKAAQIHFLIDSGAYDNAGLTVATKALLHCTGAYAIPHVKITGDYVYTNNPPGGAFKGFGTPQVVCCHEGQMDALAQQLHLSAYEIRKINGLQVDSQLITGSTLTAEFMPSYLETLDAAVVKAKEVWGADVGQEKKSADVHKKRGWGLGTGYYGVAYPGKANPSSAFVEVNFDGTVYLRCSAVDFGQGSMTVLSQLAAEILGIEYEDIVITGADTSMAPDAGSSSSSRQSFVTGTAVIRACEMAKKNLQILASEILQTAVDNLEFKHRLVYDKSDPGKEITWQDLLKEMKAQGRIVVGHGTYNPSTALDDNFQGEPFEQWAFSAAITEVEVDTETGRINVVKVVSAHDIGRVLSYQGVEGQVEGSVAMGLGMVLLEKTELKNGLITNPQFSKYIIPTSMDMPEIFPVFVENQPPSGRLVPKGIGEPAIIPILPSIVSAVEDAIGIRFNNLPLTPADVLQAIREREQKAANKKSCCK